MFTMSVITEKSKEYGMFKDVVFNRNYFRIDALHLTKLRKISENNRKNFDWVLLSIKEGYQIIKMEI